MPPCCSWRRACSRMRSRSGRLAAWAKAALLAWTAGGKRYVLAGRANTRGLMRAADLMTGN